MCAKPVIYVNENTQTHGMSIGPVPNGRTASYVYIQMHKLHTMTDNNIKPFTINLCVCVCVLCNFNAKYLDCTEAQSVRSTLFVTFYLSFCGCFDDVCWAKGIGDNINCESVRKIFTGTYKVKAKLLSLWKFDDNKFDHFVLCGLCLCVCRYGTDCKVYTFYRIVNAQIFVYTLHTCIVFHTGSGKKVK